MPEINSKERILAKLQEFDDRMAGAISAAKKMVEVKDNVHDMEQSISGALQQFFESKEAIRNIEAEWDDLKSDFEETREEFINDIHNRLIDHKKLEGLSREHQEKTAADREIIIQQIDSLQQLLKNSRQRLESEIKENLIESGKYIHSQVSEIEKSLWEKQQDSMKNFKEEVNKELYGHQQHVERNLTEFLNKQNILVQNLTQQIDAFQRSNQALASEQQQMHQQIKGLEDKVLKDSSKQDAEINRLQSKINSVAERLEEIIKRLQSRLFSGGAFKGL